MAELDLPTVKIQVLVERNTRVGKWNSAFYYSYDEYQVLTQQQIDDRADEESEAWAVFIEEQSQQEGEPEE